MLALILGKGRVPVHLTQALRETGMAFRFLHLAGTQPEAEAAPGHARTPFRIEELGTLLQDLREEGVTHVVFAGGIDRPAIDPARIDAATMPLVPAMMAALQSGDDAAFRAVIGFFEQAGLTVRAPEDYAPSLLPPTGILTKAQPEGRAEADVARAAMVVDALGAADVGQGAVISRGLVLAVEALPGTDAMLRSLAATRRDLPLPPGGVLWKAPKPDQDLRIDRPTIGPDTVLAAAEAGLDGIAVPAGGVLFPERAAAIAAADDTGLFIGVGETG